MSKRTVDFVVVAVILAFTTHLWTYWSLPTLVGLGLFTLLPTAYLWYRRPRNFKAFKITILAVLALGILFGVVFDLAAAHYNAWQVQHLAFPNLILGIQSVSNIFGYAILSVLMLTLYEHFIDTPQVERASRRWTRTSLLGKIALLAVLFAGVWLIAEYATVSVNSWVYTDQYIPWGEFLGMRFPVWELLVWMLGYAVVVTTFYEYLVDDTK